MSEPSNFNLTSTFSLSGDQPKAVEDISEGLLAGKPFQTLEGVTGSGKDVYYGQCDRMHWKANSCHLT